MDDYDGKYMKTKFNLDGKLTLYKMIEIPSIIIAVRAISYKQSFPRQIFV